MTENDLWDLLLHNNVHKTRYGFTELRREDGIDRVCVRAVQGHSERIGNIVDMEQILRAVQPGDADWSDLAYHGTQRGKAQSIGMLGLDTCFSEGSLGLRQSACPHPYGGECGHRWLSAVWCPLWVSRRCGGQSASVVQFRRSDLLQR